MSSSQVFPMSWVKLVTLARLRSSYYSELYKEVPSNPGRLDLLPLVDQVEFWKANTIQNNRVLTGSMQSGIVFKSGGTTGSPKFSVYTQQEWNYFTSVFGRGLAAGGLVSGDRVANLFYAGDLYASFLFIMKSMESLENPVLHFPLGGAANATGVLQILNDFKIDVVAGVPTTLMRFVESYASEKAKYPMLKLRKVLFGGESMYPDQRTRLSEIFPELEIQSIGYASVDAGLLGYADEECAPDEHRVFGKETVVELIDEETGEIIVEVNRPGKLIVTNLVRSLMPIIRYPSGDRAMWVEPAECVDRKFRILGRSEEAARVGPASIYYEDLRLFLERKAPTAGILKPCGFQLVISHFEHRDELLIRIATAEPPGERCEQAQRILTQAFYAERPMYSDLVREGAVHPARVQWIGFDQLEVNLRTGKLKRVIDLRK